MLTSNHLVSGWYRAFAGLQAFSIRLILGWCWPATFLWRSDSWSMLTCKPLTADWCCHAIIHCWVDAGPMLGSKHLVSGWCCAKAFPHTFSTRQDFGSNTTFISYARHNTTEQSFIILYFIHSHSACHLPLSARNLQQLSYLHPNLNLVCIWRCAAGWKFSAGVFNVIRGRHSKICYIGECKRDVQYPIGLYNIVWISFNTANILTPNAGAGQMIWTAVRQPSDRSRFTVIEQVRDYRIHHAPNKRHG